MKNKLKKLKIGIVCYPSVGGSGIVATGLGNELARLGHQIHFLSYETPFLLDTKLPNVFFHKVELNDHELFKYPDYTLPLAVKMGEVSDKYKLDIMHVHYAVPHATAALLAKNIASLEGMHFPNVITTLHGTDITLLARDKNLVPVIKYSIEDSCGVTAVSESLRKDTIKALKTKKEISVIHNFYNPKKAGRTRQSVRKSLGVKEEDFLVIHLSNLRKVKRIPDLLTILSKAKKLRGNKIKLLILAGGDFTPYEKLVQKLKISDIVIIKRNIEDIENYISAADLGLYTSEEESFGMGILETMSYGKPVLATNVGGIGEVVESGVTGFLFPLGRTDQFAKKLVELSTKPELVKNMGENASMRARTHFSAEKIVGEYLAYYNKVVSCN